MQRFGFVFRMELAGKKPRMFVARQLDHFNKFSIGRNATKHQPALFKLSPIFRIELITMSMALANHFLAVNFMGQRTISEIARPGTETHRATQFFNPNEISQFEDYWMRRFRIEFR